MRRKINKELFKYFNNSVVFYNQLWALQDLLYDNIRTLSLKKPASFRWLSPGATVSAIYNSYPAIYSTLENQAASKDAPDAKGLLQKRKSVAFLLTTAFLLDLLCVNKLNLMFLCDQIDVSAIKAMVTSSTERLTYFKQQDSTNLSGIVFLL